MTHGYSNDAARSMASTSAYRMRALMVLVALALGSPAAFAQFSSGSTGADGALDLTGQEGVIELDPQALGIDPERDNVFHFTTVRIPAGVTLRLRVTKLRLAPVYWLATGPVEIDGDLDLSGDDGHPGNAPLPHPALPGPGGFHGGVGGRPDNAPPMGGFGPEGGAAQAGAIPGLFLTPLRGGSGGAGNFANPSVGLTVGPGGSAGGGAILIASDDRLRIDGKISCNGGAPGEFAAGAFLARGYPGAGGGIRILAPRVSGAGTLEVRAGNPAFVDNSGVIRVETSENAFSGALVGRSRVVTLTPTVRFRPDQLGLTIPELRVVRVSGVELPLAPTGTFVMPDVVIETGSAVFEIEARNIPIGTTVTLEVWNETLGRFNFTSIGLEGTFESSTATATRGNFPSGYSLVVPYARWQ